MSEEVNTTPVNDIPVPTRTSPKWTEYVLSHFIESELENGNPKVGGLRRVVELLIGPIHVMTPHVVTTPTRDNGWRAVVEYTIEVDTGGQGVVPRYMSFGGSADANPQNTDGVYSKYPVAIAETRAKARALKNALGIEVVAADELSEVAKLESEQDFDSELINETQITVINAVCKRLDISVQAFANIGKNRYNSIREVPHQVAIKMTQQLSKYQQDMSSIPDNIKKYDENWRENFNESPV